MRRNLLAAFLCLGLTAGCDDDDGKGVGPADGGTGGVLAEAGAGGTGGGNTLPDGGATMDVVAEVGSETGDEDAGPTSSSALIVASVGGSLSAGGATLSVPAGALSADETLTVLVTAPGNDPWTASIYGQIYDFGPDGTQFQVPVTMTLPIGTVPAHKMATVAYLDDPSGEWFPLPATIDAGGTTITALVSHFTAFAVVLLDKDVHCPFSGACGGALDGTWEYHTACAKPQPPQPVTCGSGGTILLHQQLGVGGTITIAQGQYTSNRTTTLTGTLFYTAACLAALNQAQTVYADCAAVQEGLRTDRNAPWTCDGTLAQGCSCTVDNVVEEADTGTVTVLDKQVTFTKTGAATPGKPADFCVRSDALIVKDADGALFTALKK